MLRSVIVMSVFVLASATSVIASERILFDFDQPKTANEWQTVNDGVMGGRSVGRFKINTDEAMEFFGNLSLENNGGFASVRSRESKLGIQAGDPIVIRVRGDGRQYNLRLNLPRSVGRISYQQAFKTEKDKWIEVTLPMEKFVASWRGRMFPNEKLDPRNVSGMGIQLSDKKPGPFKLEIDWIKAGTP
ncbi:CIA30 family protein [bacterium]|nr:CIA30 family protein [bacterium]